MKKRSNRHIPKPYQNKTSQWITTQNKKRKRKEEDKYHDNKKRKNKKDS